MAIVGTIYGLIVVPEGMDTTILVSNFSTINRSGISSLFAAVVATAFAYEGWILATTINSELKDAKKNLPKALILGTAIVMIIYIIYYIGVAGGASVESLVENGATIAFYNIFGTIGGTILNVFIAISCLGTLNGLMLSCTRNMYSLAIRKTGPSPEVFKEIDTQTNMPTNSAIMGLLLSGIWLFYFYAANLGMLFSTSYDAETASWIIKLLGSLDNVTNTYIVNWFSFDSSELPIVAIYGMYIPIFIGMMKMKDLSIVKRIVMPLLAIIGSVFMIIAAIYSHKIGVLYFMVVAVIIMIIGRKYQNELT